MLTDKQKTLSDVLDTLAASEGFVGSLLVSRDGFCLLNRCPSLPLPDTFSAMAATLMGAADAALQETGADEPLRVIVESGARTVVVVAASAEILLISITDASLPIADVLPRVHEAVAQVVRIVDG